MSDSAEALLQVDQVVSDREPLLGGDYLTPAQLALELGVSERTLHRWHTERVGAPRICIGKKVLYKRASVLAWLSAREEQPARKGRR